MPKTPIKGLGQRTIVKLNITKCSVTETLSRTNRIYVVCLEHQTFTENLKQPFLPPSSKFKIHTTPLNNNFKEKVHEIRSVSVKILLRSSHSSSFFRLTLIYTPYFSRKKQKYQVGKKKKVNSKVYTFIQLKHYIPNSAITKTAFEQPKVSLTIGRKRIVWLEIHGKSVYRSGKEKVTTFCLLSPYILLSLQTRISSGFACLFRD